MEFSGPQPADFANVRSLNIAFLRCLRGVATGVRMREVLPDSAATTVLGLGEGEIVRLAEMPLLLVSVREYDDGYWQALLDSEPTRDLLKPRAETPVVAQVAAAVLGFLWQLARHNPYATRLVSGATPDWCRRITACTLPSLLWRALEEDELLRPRFATEAGVWERLLGPGLSPMPEVRNAAQISVLQRLLTNFPDPARMRRRAAACRSAVPSVSVAEAHRRG